MLMLTAFAHLKGDSSSFSRGKKSLNLYYRKYGILSILTCFFFLSLEKLLHNLEIKVKALSKGGWGRMLQLLQFSSSETFLGNAIGVEESGRAAWEGEGVRVILHRVGGAPSSL